MTFLLALWAACILLLLPAQAIEAAALTRSPFAAVNTADAANCIQDNSNDWKNGMDILTQNDIDADITNNNYDNGESSERLDASNFGFAIPDGSTVSGVLVEADKYSDNGSAVDFRIQLLKAGVLVGSNKADTVTPWPVSDTDTYSAYGGSSDLWGAVWSENDIENSGFGVAVCSRATSNNTDVHIDHIRITVYYALPDITAPAAVTDLSLSNPSGSSMTVSWTAPGDDGNAGTAASYDLRYSTSNTINTDWASATAATGEPTPSAAGSAESMTVSGLSASTPYYFALKSSDEVPNESALSNIPSLATTDGVSPPPSSGGGSGVIPRRVVFSGKAYPGSKIEVLRKSIQDQLYVQLPAETAILSEDGIFSLIYTGLIGGDYLFALRVTDADGRTTGALTFNVSLFGDLFEAKNIIIPPTIGFENSSVAKNELLNAAGYAAPNATVELEIDGMPYENTKANRSGFWSIAIDTVYISYGEHSARVRQIAPGDAASNFSLTRVFKLSKRAASKADLNGDSIGDISDWSIFLFRWGSEREELRSQNDLNGDGKINIFDFSIFLQAMKL